MTQDNQAAEREQLEQAIAHLESQRAILGDGVVDTALAPLHEKLAELGEQKPPTPEEPILSLPKGERRIVTVLFSDVTGSTALAASLDPEEWTSIINQIFQRFIDPVERYGGTVARLMGDGILAFFGAPRAHEDDPQRAILAGLDILHGIRTLREELQKERDITFDVRVGINTGLAVVGEVGSHIAGEYTALGDAVNVAARMEQTARPGTLQIADPTYRQVFDRFNVEPLGPVQAKGMREPVPAYRVLGQRLGAGQQRGVVGATTPLIGRDREMGILRQIMAKVRQGNGQIVSIIGEAGMGKSRLIAELKAEWLALQPEDEKPTIWREMVSNSYSGNRPYGTFQTQIQEAAGITSEDTAESSRAKLSQMLQQDPGHEGLQELYEQLLGIHSTERAAIDGETFRRRLFATTLKSVAAEIGDFPALLVYEDAHWTDAASMALEVHMLQLVHDRSLLTLTSFRPDPGSPAWSMREEIARVYGDIYTEIWLQPLATGDSEVMVDHLFTNNEGAPGDDLPQNVRQIILDRSDGNPFFIEEIIHALVDQGFIVQEAGRLRWQGDRQLADLDIPVNVHSLLAARIDRLASDVRRTLQLASIIGRTFYYRVLAMISENTADLENHLGTLQEVDLIHESGRLPEWEFIFRHALTQEAAYKTLLREERRTFHLRVGQVLENLFPDRQGELAPLLAMHYAEARQPEKAIRYYIMAGDTAFRLYANVEAAAHYSHALSFAGELDLDSSFIVHLYTRRGRALDLLSDHPASIANYEEAISTARERGDKALELAGLNGLATILATVNPQFDSERSLGLATQALGLAQLLGDSAAAARAHWNIMLVQWYGLGDMAEAVIHGEASLAIARQDNLREQTAYTLTDLGLAYGGIGQWAQGIKTFEEGRAIWRELDNLPMLANNLSNSTISYVLTGDFEKAMATGNEAHEISRSIDNVWGQISSIIMSLHVLREYAEIGRGIKRFNEAQTRLKGIESVKHAVAFGKGIISCMYAGLGAAALGQSEFEAACELVDTQPGFIKPWLIATLSLREIEAENLDTGADFLDRCLQIVKLDCVYSPAHAVAYLVRGRLSLARGSYQEAIGEFGEMLAAFKEAGVLWLAADAHYHLSQAHLALGETKQAYGTLIQARDTAEPLNSRRILWRIYAGLAAIEPEEGSAAAYREQARQIVNYIAGHAGSGPLRDAFLNLPEVKVL